MSMVVNTNVLSLVTQNDISRNNQKLNTAVEQLSSGLRINNASDDPAGLAIASQMQDQVSGMNQAVNNANDAIAAAQTTDGALSSIGNILQQMSSLAVEGANGTNSATDLSNLNTEYQALASEITREIGATTFNGSSILEQTGSVTYQVGANSGGSNQITVAGLDLSTDASIGTSGTVTTGAITSTSAASTLIGDIQTAIDSVNTDRAQVGANEIQFNQVVQTLQTDSQNTAAAQSQIMDTDYAQATSNLTQAEIVQQAGTAMLSQANSIPQNVLSLLSKLP